MGCSPRDGGAGCGLFLCFLFARLSDLDLFSYSLLAIIGMFNNCLKGRGNIDFCVVVPVSD